MHFVPFELSQTPLHLAPTTTYLALIDVQNLLNNSSSPIPGSKQRRAACEGRCEGVDTRGHTFSICSASSRSLGSLRLGLKVSGSSSVLMDVPWCVLASSLVVICHGEPISVRGVKDSRAPDLREDDWIGRTFRRKFLQSEKYSIFYLWQSAQSKDCQNKKDIQFPE